MIEFIISKNTEKYRADTALAAADQDINTWREETKRFWLKSSWIDSMSWTEARDHFSKLFLVGEIDHSEISGRCGHPEPRTGYNQYAGSSNLWQKRWSLVPFFDALFTIKEEAAPGDEQENPSMEFMP